MEAFLKICILPHTLHTIRLKIAFLELTNKVSGDTSHQHARTYFPGRTPVILLTSFASRPAPYNQHTPTSSKKARYMRLTEAAYWSTSWKKKMPPRVTNGRPHKKDTTQIRSTSISWHPRFFFIQLGKPSCREVATTSTRANWNSRNTQHTVTSL